MSASTIRLVARCRGRQLPVALADYLDADLREAVAIEANQWIKQLRLARVGEGSLRDQFHYRGDSLWWFTELYLHKEARIVSWVETIRAFERCLDQCAAEQVIVRDANAEDRVLLATVAGARGIECEGTPQRGPGLGERLRLDARSRFYTWSAHLSRARSRRPPPPVRRGGVATFVHSAFWRRPVTSVTEGEEGYIGPVIDDLRSRLGDDALTLVGVGPRVNFRARPWWHGLTAPEHDTHLPPTPVEAFANADAVRPSLEVWRRRLDNERRLLESRDVRDAARVAGYDLWPLVSRELRGVVRLQWPWSARAMDEAGAVFDALAPSVAVTYAEAGGWGRALILEARRRGIPSVGLQHGFIYRHWLNYRHEPDEMQPSPVVPTDRGFPHPTRTLLFDAYAEAHLRQAGHFPADALAVTGSPRLDALVSSVGRLAPHDLDEARRHLGAAPDEAVVLVATKYGQIRRVFRRLVEAVAELPAVRLVVKCHPAETPEPYLRDARGFARMVVAPADADLAHLLAVSRAIITVNSTVAIDALVLGVPALVVDLPNNLSPFVDAGVMAGALSPSGIGPSLAALVSDSQGRAALLARRDGFLARYRMGSDGKAAARASRQVLALAGVPPALAPR